MTTDAPGGTSHTRRFEMTSQYKLESTEYSALPSPPRLMRCAVDKRLGGHTQRDSERHNTFPARQAVAKVINAYDKDDAIRLEYLYYKQQAVCLSRTC